MAVNRLVYQSSGRIKKAANAALGHVRSFTFGTDGDDWTSAAVCSDGSYGVPEGLISV